MADMTCEAESPESMPGPVARHRLRAALEKPCEKNAPGARAQTLARALLRMRGAVQEAIDALPLADAQAAGLVNSAHKACPAAPPTSPSTFADEPPLSPTPRDGDETLRRKRADSDMPFSPKSARLLESTPSRTPRTAISRSSRYARPTPSPVAEPVSGRAWCNLKGLGVELGDSPPKLDSIDPSIDLGEWIEVATPDAPSFDCFSE